MLAVAKRHDGRDDALVAGRAEALGNGRAHGCGDGRIDIEREMWAVLLGCPEWHDHTHRSRFHTMRDPFGRVIGELQVTVVPV